MFKQIYKHILITYFNEFDAIDFNNPPKCINNDKIVITQLHLLATYCQDVMKKNQISKHDYVCKQIYKHLLITHF